MSESHTPTVDTTIIERYIDFWNADDSAEQSRLAVEVLADEITYHAPVGVLHGVDALNDFRSQFADFAPDYVFRARRAPDRHHDRGRLQWELVVRGETFATGTDVLELDGTGRIEAISSFLDRAPDGFTDAAHDAGGTP